MKRACMWGVIYVLRFFLWFRYRVTYEGRENLNSETLNKPGGVLILPNHPSVFIDPVLVGMGLWRHFPQRPMVTEYYYYQTFLHPIMKMVNAIPVPSFEMSSNSLKRKRSEEVIDTVISGLGKGENFLIYPSGRTKQTAIESIGGASAVHRIIESAPDANVVLVRTKGLWGSSFSRAVTGHSPSMGGVILQSLKHVIKNLIFFIPRRRVIVEYVPAPDDFPYNASRLEMNRWLERWYNQPDGLTEQEGEQPGDSLMLVSYSMWSQQLPELYTDEKEELGDIDIAAISADLKRKVIQEIARITQIAEEEIKESDELDVDLGMDSLDSADLTVFIQDHFDIKNVPVRELTSVAKVLAIADGQLTPELEKESSKAVDFEKWFVPIQKEKIQIAPGNTIPEVFLNSCQRMGKRAACADTRSGILTYSDLKLRTILLAEKIRHLPGENVGIMLPSTVAAYLTVMATLLAGKVPVMINWTVGPRHLEAVVELSNVQVILSSLSFLDRLANVDLSAIEDALLMLEDLRRDFSIKEKAAAWWQSKRTTEALLNHFNVQNLSKESRAVLLFTSGTESAPKGVPLTHRNILSNQRSCCTTMDFFSDDIMVAVLPPFHAFGFTISGLLALLAGARTVYSPDPTDGRQLAETVKKWRGSILCGAPTFLKGMFRVGTPAHFRSLRICVTGAEKAPRELYTLAETMGVDDQKLLEGYGITECAPVLTMNRPGKKPSGVGQPLEGIELKVVHPETYASVEEGEHGLVLARGPNIFGGYLNPDVASPFVTIDGEQWYKTGDLGYLDDEGRLIISGRQKRFIKVAGEMISLGAIEDSLLEVAAKKEGAISDEGPTLAVCAKEKPGEKPLITLFTKEPVDLDDVNSTLRDAGFSNLVKVTSVTQLKEIPIMGTGKINYRSLEDQFMV